MTIPEYLKVDIKIKTAWQKYTKSGLHCVAMRHGLMLSHINVNARPLYVIIC